MSNAKKVLSILLAVVMVACLSVNAFAAVSYETDTTMTQTWTLSEATEERIALLEEALKRLSPPDRTAVTLFYYEERTAREIAFILGTSVSNVTTRLHRVRKRLYLLIKQLEHEQER